MLFLRSSTSANGTTSATPAIPTGAITGDILLLMIETTQTETPTVPDTFTAIAGSPFTAADTRLHVFWRRHTAGDAAPACTGTTDHISALLQCFAGCVSSGNPIDQVASSIVASGTSAATFPAVTPTGAGYGIFHLAATGADAAVNPLSSYTAPNLDTTTISPGWTATTQGNGGGVATLYGQQTTSSPVATSTTGVMANTGAKALVTLSLIPEPDPNDRVYNAQMVTVASNLADNSLAAMNAQMVTVVSTTGESIALFNAQMITVVIEIPTSGRRRQTFSPT